MQRVVFTINSHANEVMATTRTRLRVVYGVYAICRIQKLLRFVYFQNYRLVLHDFSAFSLHI